MLDWIVSNLGWKPLRLATPAGNPLVRLNLNHFILCDAPVPAGGRANAGQRPFAFRPAVDWRCFYASLRIASPRGKNGHEASTVLSNLKHRQSVAYKVLQMSLSVTNRYSKLREGAISCPPSGVDKFRKSNMLSVDYGTPCKAACALFRRAHDRFINRLGGCCCCLQVEPSPVESATRGTVIEYDDKFCETIWAGARAGVLRESEPAREPARCS
ncbi:hypothetical protein EVAR_27910_1 [Eumeta japonica]|uniref:Uncharacterized protein n=1 Tax=Eumeta variegata TaxID=151549 RepID=A0A4C1UW99_EUMVA|nr:hypothetical protein EVAR_27910_1 [Eumeta japonica]